MRPGWSSERMVEQNKELMKQSRHATGRCEATVPEEDVRTGVSPMYFSLRALAVYSGLTNRLLREYLHDRVHPLPHFRIGGKILVKRDDFDHWVTQFRRVTPSIDVGAIVDDVMRSVGRADRRR